LSKRLRVAMVGPLPPERSGIAEYAEGLVDMLRSEGLQVDTVTRSDVDRRGLDKVIASLNEMDVVVYQMGNHPTFHGWMLPLMSTVPGIVHLHDLVLHHMVAGVLNEEGLLLTGGYAEALKKWHSASQIRSASLALRCESPVWNRDEVVEYPLHQIATKFATEVVVHSHYAANRITAEFPWLPVSVIPQLYPAIAPHRVREQLATIVLMGGGQVNRRFDWVVEALTAIDDDLDQTVTLEIAGEVEPAVLVQLQGLEALKKVRLINHGRTSDSDFEDLFKRADLMIALRQPTMGEASAVVSKALQAGLPTIVSDQGWYAELPGCVKKIAPTDDCPQALARLLRELILDPLHYSGWAESCMDESGRPLLDPVAATGQYVRLLRSHCVFSNFRDRLADAVSSLKVNIDSPLSSELQRIDVRATLRGDRWVGRALAALADQELDSEARIAGSTVGPYPYTGPLPASGYAGSATLPGVAEPLVVKAAGDLSLQVELHNDGPNEWVSPVGHALRPYGIYLGHFWRRIDNQTSSGEQPRTWIEDAVDPHATLVLSLQLRAPEVAGEYELEIDLVQESVCWFKSHGFIPARLRVSVGSDIS